MISSRPKQVEIGVGVDVGFGIRVAKRGIKAAINPIKATTIEIMVSVFFHFHDLRRPTVRFIEFLGCLPVKSDSFDIIVSQIRQVGSLSLGTLMIYHPILCKSIL
jgi:hypothetical protein